MRLRNIENKATIVSQAMIIKQEEELRGNNLQVGDTVVIVNLKPGQQDT